MSKNEFDILNEVFMHHASNDEKEIYLNAFKFDAERIKFLEGVNKIIILPLYDEVLLEYCSSFQLNALYKTIHTIVKYYFERLAEEYLVGQITPTAKVLNEQGDLIFKEHLIYLIDLKCALVQEERKNLKSHLSTIKEFEEFVIEAKEIKSAISIEERILIKKKFEELDNPIILKGSFTQLFFKQPKFLRYAAAAILTGFIVYISLPDKNSTQYSLPKNVLQDSTKSIVLTSDTSQLNEFKKVIDSLND